MSKFQNENKKVLRASCIGAVVLLLSMVITGLIGISNRIYGFRESMENYLTIWQPMKFQSPFAMIGLVILAFDVIAFITVVAFAIIKKKYILIVPAILFAIALAFLPFLFILTFPLIEKGQIYGRLAYYTLAIAMLLNVLSIVILYIPIKALVQEGFGFVNQLVTGEKEEDKPCANEERCCEKATEQSATEQSATEQPAEEPVEEKVEETVEETATDEEPAEEEAVEEEPEENEDIAATAQETEPAEEPTAENDVFGKLNAERRKRASFETRLKNSEYDLRHKYYDLRDYIKYYGLRNRVSFNGDSFYYKRKKLAFITIVGKHVRLYSAIDPAKYADSPIPVETAESKKYEKVPALLKIKSDLSYRRGKKIIDAVMAEEGIVKPEGPAPKETQKKD